MSNDPWLNYHHLLYFWTVAREGGVSRAAASLRLSQPTVSAQVRVLEETLGTPLFVREGRRLTLSEAGRVAFRYADEIFSLGRELTGALAGRSPGRLPPLTVGVADAVPKLIVSRLLSPAVRAAHPVHLVCREGAQEALLADLATHALDAVIADTPAPPHARVKVFNHLLGESAITLFAAPAIAAKVRRKFPASLDGAAITLPARTTALRRDLDAWFDRVGVRPRVVGEFDDTALMKALARAQGAIFPAPSAIERDVSRIYGARVAGRPDGVSEKYYVISAERRLTHPGVRAITEAGRAELFG